MLAHRFDAMGITAGSVNVGAGGTGITLPGAAKV